MPAPSSRSLNALGLMSGTSLDGVDLALLRTDGERIEAFGPSAYVAYGESDRNVLRRALIEATGLRDRHSRPGILGEAERLVTNAHAQAVETFLAQNPGVTVDLVGFHGQTVLHRPGERLTVQLGDGQALSRRLGLPVVFDLRAADVEAGGEGAPLVPVFHRALVEKAGLRPPVAILNLGGVANVTYIGGGDTLIAFDTGPANALMDDFVRERTGEPFDRDGRLAGAGHVHRELLEQWLDDPYFQRRPPKSLDRNAFRTLGLSGLDDANGAATLLAFTVETVRKGFSLLPVTPGLCILAGGGACNASLVAALEAALPAPVHLAEQFGWSGALLEAQAFAFLAARSVNDLPLTFPGTTGVPEPLTGGVLVAA